jgi:hypothetical protein
MNEPVDEWPSTKEERRAIDDHRRWMTAHETIDESVVNETGVPFSAVTTEDHS